jgi:hypothetical protein
MPSKTAPHRGHRAPNRRVKRAAAVAAAALAIALPFGRAATTTIALSDAAVPEGNGQFDLFAEPLLNASGQVAVLALLKNTAGGSTDNFGIYLYNGTTLLNRARQNGVLPDGNGRFGGMGNFVLNNAGQLAFYSALQSTSGGANDDSGIYYHDGSSVFLRARENAPVPEGNGLFNNFAPPVIDAAGDVAFYAGLKSTAGGTADNSGLYLHNGTILTNFARANGNAPGGGQYSGFAGVTPALHGGMAVYYADLKNTTGGATDNSGIFFYRGFDTLQVVRENALVPEGNGRFDYFDFPWPAAVLNGSSQIAFTANLRNTTAPGVDDSGIYLWDNGVLINRARENALVPEGNGRFDSFQLPVLNTSGEILFQASLRGTSGATADDSGIYLHNGTTMLNIARENAAAPDDYGLFSGFREPVLNSGGQVAFVASLKNTPAGSDSGIYLGDGTEQMKVIRTGETLAGKTVLTLYLYSGTTQGASQVDSRGTPFNDSGQVAYGVQFSDGTAGVCLFTPDLRWRAAGGGNWDSTANWTLGLRPGAVHAVTINPAANLTVLGPAAATTVKSLQIGGNNGSGVATLQLQPGGNITSAPPVVVAVTGVLTGNGTVNADVTNNGTVLADNLTINGTLTSNGTISGTGSITSPHAIVIGPAGTLTGTGTFNANVTNNGSVVANNFTINGTLTNNATVSGNGKVIATNLVNAASGVLTGTLTLGGNVTNNGTVSTDDLIITGALTNNAVLEGNGRVTGAVNNAPAGQLRVNAGQEMRFLTSGNTNAGTAQVIGGSLDYTGSLNNSGTITGREMILHFGGTGLTNTGNVQMSFGASDVFGNIANNSGGKLTVSGNSTVTFYNNITNNAGGLVQVSTGSTAVFFGNVTNNGTFSGAGTKFFEGGSSGNLGPLATTGATVVGAGADVTPHYKPEPAHTGDGAAQILANGSDSGTSRTSALSVAGQLDLSNNALIVAGGAIGSTSGGTYSGVTGLIQSGFNLGGTLWAGPGITTSLGGNGSGNFHALGVILNDLASVGQPSGPIYTSFGGQDVGVNDVLVKYTYFGDADLDGAVTTNDYFQIDNGFLGSKTGWINGDFDYDGAVTTNDYFLIDNAFLGQGSALVPTSLGGAAPLSGVTAVPEPASLGVFAFAAAALLARRRRRLNDGLCA